MQHDRPLFSPSVPRSAARQDAEPVPDRVLLERVAVGEARALAALLARHGPRLYTFALGMLCDPAAAAAVVKSVARDVLYETRRFSPSQYPVGRWLTELTRRAALHQLRARASAPAA